MFNVTTARGEVTAADQPAAADRPAGAGLANAGPREEKLSLAHSALLIVLGSVGGWCLLVMAVLWLMS